MNLRRPAWRGLSIALLALALISGCEQDLPSPRNASEASDTPQPPERAPLSEGLETSWQNYHQRGRELIGQVAECIKHLDSQTQAFLASPAAASLAELVTLTHHCHALYLASEALTATTDTLEARLDSLRARIDTRPMTPGFVDYVRDYPDAGIVNDPALPLNAQNLIAEQGLTAPTDLVLGFEVLLFLLEGEHRQDTALPLRPASDFVAATEWLSSGEESLPLTEHPTHRRRRLLSLVIEILAMDLDLLSNAWAEWHPPQSADQERGVSFATLRNWHGVLTSLPADATPTAAPALLRLLDGGLAKHHGIDQLPGWSTDPRQLNVSDLGQSMAGWLDQQHKALRGRGA